MDKIKTVTLAGSRYALTRDRDGWGDSGSDLRCIEWHSEGRRPVPNTQGQISIGYGVLCGTKGHWVVTTPVQEFLEVDPELKWVKFRTENSVYLARLI